MRARSSVYVVLWRRLGQAVIVGHAGQPQDLGNGIAHLFLGPVGRGEHYRLVVGVLDLSGVAAESEDSRRPRKTLSNAWSSSVENSECATSN
jgi:hypothetical protein